jgi:uncharacterized membrane protein YgaE (UPF0421/DUF939 family)
MVILKDNQVYNLEQQVRRFKDTMIKVAAELKFIKQENSIIKNQLIATLYDIPLLHL